MAAEREGGPPAQARGDRELLDFSRLVRRLFWTAVALAALAVVGAVIEGLVAGLTFAVLGRWGTYFGLALVVAAAAVIAAHALGGARRARRRGERLASDDVGLSPTERPGAQRPEAGTQADRRDPRRDDGRHR